MSTQNAPTCPYRPCTGTGQPETLQIRSHQSDYIVATRTVWRCDSCRRALDPPE